MRLLHLLILFASALCASCTSPMPPGEVPHVLFVGNSLTYVGNTPAVFAALSRRGDHPVVAEMIVEGGATLSQRLKDGSVARALSARKYSTVVLQERGGDLLCSFGPSSCEESRQAIAALTALAMSGGAKVVLLGTYQSMPRISVALVEAESAAAGEAGILYAEISKKLQVLQKELPETQWFDPDGMHPSSNLALLNALTLFEVLYNTEPPAGTLIVRAPIYGTSSGLTSVLTRADAPPPRSDTRLEISYGADEIQSIVSGLKSGS